MSSNFDLRAAVAAVLDSSDLAAPEDVAAKVAENVPSRDLRHALALALADYVRVQMGDRRRSNVILSGEEQRKQSARSSKVAGIRDAWAIALRDRIHVEGGWKLLGECAYEDLLFAAAERREMAAKNLAKADRFEWLAARLQTAGVSTVAELPRQDLETLAVAA